ncbi:hypothetical protein ACIA8G_41075 [Lentzea sp. NPDC051213]|uniref:hypothetical protein n=1 Tax=Lentzea sp. NPDC051213 TaxID=3364126 RepID=UPI00379F2E91
MVIFVIVIATVVIVAYVLRTRALSARRSKVVAEQIPALTALAESLDGEVIGPDGASPWSPKLQRAAHQPGATLGFRRGPWHVRVTEASQVTDPVLSDSGQIWFEHWIEVATVLLPQRRIPLEFFTLYFEDGFVHTECQGKIQPDELVFLVDMIVETLELMPGVEPRNPATTA